MAASLVLRRGVTKVTTILCLYGDLGSGKTTFTQGFAKGLGVTARLLSPTFIIVRRYQFGQPMNYLYHLDLYRMNTIHEIQNLGFSEIIRETGSFVLIEWAERLGTLLPERRIDVSFAVSQDDAHSITIDDKR